ncbi:MAG TPA: response regulator transcription factor, partial [Verrucomicrobiae bacterium]
MSSFIKIAIVDDNRDIRNNLTELVDESANLKMVGVFENGRTAVEEIPRLKPDVVIMDIELPGMDGVECVRQLKPILPEVNFLMLTVYEDSDRLFESLKAGAGGYLLKRTSSTRLLQAIGELQAGGSPMTPEIARRVTQFFSARQPAARSSNVELEQLTPGQKNFLNELAQGYSYKEIADHLGITVH